MTGSGRAQSLYWDPNGRSPASGGTGTWDNTSSLWRNGSLTGSLQAWASGANAFFGGTAGNVTVTSAGVTADVIQFTNSTGYLLPSSGGTLTLTGAGSIGNPPTLIVAGGLTAEIDNQISAVNQQWLGGGGTLILGNTANNINSWVVYGGSTLQISNFNCLGENGNAFYFNGGGVNMLTYTGPSVDCSAFLSGPYLFGVGSNVLNITQSGTIVTNATPLQQNSGSGPLVKAGAGTLDLTGANTYTAATIVNGGTLLVNSPGSITSGSAVTVNANGTFGGSGTVGGPVTFTAGSAALFTVTTNGSGANTTPMSFSGTLAIATSGTIPVVKLNLPSGLGAGVYTLASTPSGSSGVFNGTPTIISGSITAGATATVATTGGTVTLTILPPVSSNTPPIIITGPQSQEAGLGQTVQFAVFETGTPPLRYQWESNSVPISGATSTNLVLANITAASAATYTVVVTNNYGTNAASATLTVVSNAYFIGNVRVETLSPTVVRLEVQGPEGFEDRLTYHVVNRNWPGDNATIATSGSVVLITTPDYVISVPKVAAPLSGITISNATGNLLWSYVGLPSNTTALPGPTDNLTAWAIADTPRMIPASWGYNLEPANNTNNYNTDGWDLNNDSPDLYVFLPKGNLRQLRSDFNALTGPTQLLPLHALGIWDSRYYEYTAQTALQQIQNYSASNFPLDNLVIDTQWRAGGSTGYIINSNDFPNLPQFFSEAHGSNIWVMFNDHPLPINSALNPQEVAYRDTGLDSILEDGLDVWWYDRNWSVTLESPSPSLTPTEWGMYLYNWTMYDFYPNRRPLIMANVDNVTGGSWGGAEEIACHRYDFQWTGDIQPGFPSLQQEIQNAINEGIYSDFPYTSCDLGGHVADPTAENYVRWIQYGVLSPIVRPHCTEGLPLGGRMPWLWGEPAESIARYYYDLRYRLLAYLYQLARHNYDTGDPLLKRCDFDYPAYSQASTTTQYLLGDRILVAPIITSGGGGVTPAAQGSVWIPPGDWIDAWSGTVYTGPETLTTSAYWGTIPIYIETGTIIPLAPFMYNTLQMPWDPVTLDTYPDRNNVATNSLYEDDNVSSGYQTGAYRTTALIATANASNQTVTVQIMPAQGTFTGASSTRGWFVRIHQPYGFTNQAPATITVDGSPAIGWSYVSQNTNQIDLTTNVPATLSMPFEDGAGAAPDSAVIVVPIAETPVATQQTVVVNYNSSLGTVPPPPIGLTANYSSNQVVLQWNAVTGATYYNVLRSTNSSGLFTTIASLAATNYTDTGLANGTIYYYVVDAVNSNGASANSSQVSVTGPPLTPTGLNATAGYAQVSLSWSAVIGASSYNVLRSTNSGAETIVGTTTTPNYTDTGLASGTTYYYEVSAVNNSGQSANSSEVAAKPTGTTVFLETFSLPLGTPLVGSTANVGGTWTGTGPDIAVTNTYDTAGGSYTAFDTFTSSLGPGEILTLNYDTLVPAAGAGTVFTGWGGVSLFSGGSGGTEEVFTGNSGLGAWGTDGAGTFWIDRYHQETDGDTQVVNHVTFTYNFNTGAITFTTDNGGYSGVEEAGVVLNALRIGNGAGDQLSISNLIVNISLVLPQVGIISPANNGKFAYGTGITITATNNYPSDNITNVAYYQGSTLIANVANASGTNSYIWTNAFAGTYNLTAVAKDNNGLTATSSVVSVTVIVTNSITSIVSGNPTTLTAYGIQGYTYVMQRATNLASPVWVNIATNTVATNGVISVTDNFSDLGNQQPPDAYYRLSWSPSP
jgi:autotransporter-associated beta strand protein